jgi:hypothetical protein
MTAATRSVLLALAVLLPVEAPAGEDVQAAAGSDAVVAVGLASTLEADAASTGSTVAVSVRRGADGLEVEARCRLLASRGTAWRVLTDYDSIDRFVRSMKESRVTRRGDDVILVEQVAQGGLFLFSRRVRTTLEVREEPQERIRFEDVLRRDFVTYRGEWRIEERGSQVEIQYRVVAKPAFGMPDFVARSVFKSRVRELLSQVGDEIVRRQALAGR